MALRDDWKKTGSGLGHAFGSLGNSVVDTVKGQPTKSDWKDTGKGLGHAFTDLGKSILKSTKTAVDHLDSMVEDGEAQSAAPQESVAQETAQSTAPQESVTQETAQRTAPQESEPQAPVLTPDEVEVLPPKED